MDSEKPLSEKTLAEMEAGRAAVAYAEAKLKAKEALDIADAAKPVEAEVEFSSPKKSKK